MEINGQQYEVIRELAGTKSGTTWQIKDKENREYICKVLDETYPWKNELEIELEHYKKLRQNKIHVPELIDVDKNQSIILMEYLEGEDIFQQILNNQINKEVYIQIEQMAEIAEKAGVNLDYFPTNFKFIDDTLFYMDYECDPFMDEYSYDNWGIQYWTRTKEFDQYLQEYGAELTL